MSGFAIGALLAILAWLFRVWFLHPAAEGASGPGGGSDAMGAYNLVMSIIGFVISVLTGLAVAAAWRAVDEANRATETVRRLTNEHEFELRRIAAYAEAINDLLRARTLAQSAHKQQPLAELVEMFSLQNPRDIAQRAKSFVLNDTVFSLLGPEGVRLLGVLSQHATLDDELRMITYKAVSMAPPSVWKPNRGAQPGVSTPRAR